jgi:hypothetical protein
MQTLVDPFELASRSLPEPPPSAPEPASPRASEPEIDSRLVLQAMRAQRALASDSSARLRCWCSE